MGLGLAAGITAPASSAQARPSAPVRFCEAYPSSPDCTGRLVTCGACHTSTDPPQWNDYGVALIQRLAGADFEAGLAGAMAELEDLDADGDGETNLDEILVGTNPGRAESMWRPTPPVEGDNPWYDLGAYDPRLAYRRVMVLYCGRSADYQERQHFADQAPEEQRALLHQALSMCLDGEYWRATGLSELADARIRPNVSVGPDTEVYFGNYRLVLADYEWDYRLWRYIMSEDRDMRDLLTASYHVDEDAAGTLVRVEGVIPPPSEDEIGGQPLAPERRAGMITTQWFLMANTMFSALPRTTAAHAYRSYLGMDISQDEGIFPVAGEPTDIDDKGVDADACASCHSTLDPLAYAFAYYDGIYEFDTGQYFEDRPQEVIPGWDPDRQRSVLLGQPVSSVVEWGQVASESSYFRQTMARMFFEHALGRPLAPGERADLAAVVATIVDDGYSANRLIHHIVDTEAFGAP